jgi:hypothetical protein
MSAPGMGGVQVPQFSERAHPSIAKGNGVSINECARQVTHDHCTLLILLLWYRYMGMSLIK